MGNNMKASEILVRARSAAETHLEYARFVHDVEVLHDDADAVTDEKRTAAYQACWFELEIVNALALDEWESAGKPSDWASEWDGRYKKDAEELIGNLCAILRRLG